MWKSLVNQLLVSAVFCRAVSEQQATQYPYMHYAMQTLGLNFTWQAYELTTPDGYILTLFRITGDSEGKQISG